MYATENPVVRAGICFSCHLGTTDQFANHQLMAAGHPRLRFELESSTVNQPAHYLVDDDYRRRKGSIQPFNMWLTGQLKGATRYLELVKSGLYDTGGAFPELALYACNSCHHEMNDPQWARGNIGGGIAPGTPRLQNQHFLMLEAAAAVIEPAAAVALRGAAERFVASSDGGATAVSAAADVLLGWVGAREDAWADRTYERAQVQAVRKGILAMAIAGRLADLPAAEQACVAIESFTEFLGPNASQRIAIDALYTSIADDAYRPATFRSTAADVNGVF